MLAREMVQRTIVHGQDRVQIGEAERAVETVSIPFQPTDPNKVRLLFEPLDFAKELAVLGVLLEEDVERLNLGNERAISTFLVQKLLAKVKTLRIAQAFKSRG